MKSLPPLPTRSVILVLGLLCILAPVFLVYRNMSIAGRIHDKERLLAEYKDPYSENLMLLETRLQRLRVLQEGQPETERRNRYRFAENLLSQVESHGLKLTRYHAGEGEFLIDGSGKITGLLAFFRTISERYLAWRYSQVDIAATDTNGTLSFTMKLYTGPPRPGAPLSDANIHELFYRPQKKSPAAVVESAPPRKREQKAEAQTAKPRPDPDRNLRYLGTAVLNGATTIFLIHGETRRIIRASESIDGTYD